MDGNSGVNGYDGKTGVPGSDGVPGLPGLPVSGVWVWMCVGVRVQGAGCVPNILG